MISSLCCVDVSGCHSLQPGVAYAETIEPVNLQIAYRFMMQPGRVHGQQRLTYACVTGIGPNAAGSRIVDALRGIRKNRGSVRQRVNRPWGAVARGWPGRLTGSQLQVPAQTLKTARAGIAGRLQWPRVACRFRLNTPSGAVKRSRSGRRPQCLSGNRLWPCSTGAAVPSNCPVR